jgi:hypothetical protein
MNNNILVLCNLKFIVATYVSQDLTPCHLLAPMMDGKMVTVAHGRVHPVTKESKLHCVDLPPDMAKVDVNKVLDPFVDLDIDDRHPEPGCNKLGQCKGYVMKWPKDAIKLVGKSTRTTPQYSSKATTLANEVGICAPLTFEDLDGAVGEEHDMDQDQGVGSNSYVAPKHGAAKKGILLMRRHLQNRNMYEVRGRKTSWGKRSKG